VELLLFTGFLGSGKTTLILALAKELAIAGRLTAIIVNEIGEIGIDQSVIRDEGLEVFEITSGCICCQIGPDLVRVLRMLEEEHHPEMVIVEASGVATPGGVLDALRYFKGGLKRVRKITVVDPTRLEALIAVVTPLIESQITEADDVVITKTDEATEPEVARARAEVERLNVGARVWLVSACDETTFRVFAQELSSSDRPCLQDARHLPDRPGAAP
jgi:G3E family GTPase